MKLRGKPGSYNNDKTSFLSFAKFKGCTRHITTTCFSIEWCKQTSALHSL